MLRRNGPVIKPLSQSWGRESMVGKICERGRSWAGSEREKELWMVRVVSWQGIEHEQASQRQRDWNEVDGEHYEVDSRDRVRHTERNDQLYVPRMMLVVERG